MFKFVFERCEGFLNFNSHVLYFQFKPILDPANGQFIHHMMFYECVIPNGDGGTEKIFEKYVGEPSERCYSEAMPAEWLRHCVTVPFIWDLGGEG